MNKKRSQFIYRYGLPGEFLTECKPVTEEQAKRMMSLFAETRLGKLMLKGKRQ